MNIKKLSVKICVIAVIIITGSNFKIFAQEFNWAKSIGGLNYDEGNSVDRDALGNVYIAGAFKSTVDFDPDTSVYNLTAAGSLFDFYFAKYSPTGELIWANKVGGALDDNAYEIAVSDSGDIYITGKLTGTADFDPGAATVLLTSNGSADAFLAKYNSDGEYQWAINIGGSQFDIGLNVVIDATGNSYITGYFQITADFDPGAGITNLSSAGASDVFLAKYDVNGNLVWAKNIGGSQDDIGNAIALDNSGYIYLTGYFQGTADFDPGAGTSNLTSNGQDDIFIAKYGGTGNYVWANKIGGTSFDSGKDIVTDASGNFYLTGTFYGSADFDPSAGTTTLTSNGNYDAFFGKYNSSGNLIWAKNVGGADGESGEGIAVDDSGNVYIAGTYDISADFDPGAGTLTLPSNGGWDIYFGKYNSSGNLVYAKNIGGTGDESAKGIHATNYGGITLAGYFQNSADFDFDTGYCTLTSAGYDDVYFMQFDYSDDEIGITTFKNNGKFSVYPNPTSGIVNIVAPNNNDIREINILDISGRVVYSASFNSLETKVDISNLKNGLYYAILKGEIVTTAIPIQLVQ